MSYYLVIVTYQRCADMFLRSRSGSEYANWKPEPLDVHVTSDVGWN